MVTRESFVGVAWRLVPYWINQVRAAGALGLLAGAGAGCCWCCFCCHLGVVAAISHLLFMPMLLLLPALVAAAS